MPTRTPETRITIGTSSCLLGENVRYDGGNRHNDYITSTLASEFNLIPCCPEVAIGLGIPRPPIQLLEQHGHVRAIGRDNPLIDVTDKLQELEITFSEENKNICGYIFKSRSPSCGLTDTVTQTENGEESGPGLFASSVMAQLSCLPVIDEIKLALSDERERFLDSVRTLAKQRGGDGPKEPLIYSQYHGIHVIHCL